MTQSQRDRIERLLLRERARTLSSLEHLRTQAEEARQSASGDLSSHPIHPADRGSGAATREQALALAGQEGRYLAGIDRALGQLYRDPKSFGRCHTCHRAIPLERLEIVPHTRYCLDCKSRRAAA